MTDEYRAPTAAELRDTLHALLPHRSFELAAVRGLVGDAALMVRCSCGRVLRWPDGSNNALPMDILLTWLADHDDEIFLTPEQLGAKHNATIPPMPVPLTEEYVAKYANRLPDGGRPLVYDPNQVLGDIHRYWEEQE
jgi:hypothetical protein